jgi:hypothetical protein
VIVAIALEGTVGLSVALLSREPCLLLGPLRSLELLLLSLTTLPVTLLLG